MENNNYNEILNNGVEYWNNWKIQLDKNPDLSNLDFRRQNLSGIDLSYCKLLNTNFSRSILKNANLTGAQLNNANFKRSCLRGAKLINANLTRANFTMSDMRRTDLAEANLDRAKFRGTQLVNSNISNSFLKNTNLQKANLYRSNFDNTILIGTKFIDTDLTGVENLNTCTPEKSCILDSRTLSRSASLPIHFLSSCGVSVETIQSMLQKFQGERYSCFISYSSKDKQFVDKLYNDLIKNDVLVWFDDMDMRIGDDILDTITDNLRQQDKLIIVLSKNSISSKWVEREVKSALRMEEQEDRNVIMPINIDDSVFTDVNSNKGWIDVLKSKSMGDFQQWEKLALYDKSFARLLKDLSYVS